MVVQYLLEICHPTFFKEKPLNAKDLPDSPEYKFEVAAGVKFNLQSIGFSRNKHFEVKLAEPLHGYTNWFVFQGHAFVIPCDRSELLKPQVGMVRLNVPYFSQLDNRENPTGSCNVTSVAMCLAYFGGKPSNSEVQLEDELYRYMESKKLNRHSAQDLAKVVRDYGRSDEFSPCTSIKDVQDWLRKGFPCIIHGFFTSFGHILVVVGFDAEGFFVHDPYGEWTAQGYDTARSGAYLHYSYSLIKRLCMPDGEFWVHRIS